MIKELLKRIILGTIVFILLVLNSVLFWKYFPEVKTCSTQLFGVGIGFLIYYGFCILGNIFLMVCCFFTSKPTANLNVGKFWAAMIDCFVLTGITIWFILALTGQDTS